jgi:hypothetical protein
METGFCKSPEYWIKMSVKLPPKEKNCSKWKCKEK